MTEQRPLPLRPEGPHSSSRRGTHASLPTPGDADRSNHILWNVQILDALSDLDLSDRRALVLLYWHGLTQAQVAAELRLPEPRVRQCIARGMQLVASLTSAATGSVPNIRSVHALPELP